MKKETNNTKTTKATKVQTITPFSINAMRPALVEAHNKGYNKAINEKFAADCGVSKVSLDSWIVFVDDLRDIVEEYVLLMHDKSSTAEELLTARNLIFPKWRQILKAGEENIFSPTMFVRENDVDALIGYCDSFYKHQKGWQLAVETRQKFRKKVEILLGCRIAGNMALTGDEHEDLSTYYGAKKRIENAKNALEGYKDIKGNVIEGLRSVKTRQEKGIASLRELLENAGVGEEKIKEALKPQETALKTTENSIKQYQNNIDNAGKVLTKELEERVNKIEEKLKVAETVKTVKKRIR